MNQYHYRQSFQLESGSILPELHIAYCTYGELNTKRNNVVWVCHALTANADAADWWSGLVGPDKLLDTNKYYIVCANILGSCYGTTGSKSVNPETGKPYGAGFPLVTVRDMVRAHQLLQNHLGVNHIELAIGGSMGGQQVLEWAVADPDLFANICVLATNARHSPWGIAFNEAQRMAIAAGLQPGDEEARRKGLEAARAIAMLSYRHYDTYWASQLDDNADKLDQFRASSYQQHQGNKLYQRFDLDAYVALSKAMDSHNLSRGRTQSMEDILGSIKAKALVIGIRSDILFPVHEQEFLAKYIPQARLEVIDSIYGHDGFLVEVEAIAQVLEPFLGGVTFITTSKTKSSQLYNNFPPRRGNLPGSESF